MVGLVWSWPRQQLTWIHSYEGREARSQPIMRQERGGAVTHRSHIRPRRCSRSSRAPGRTAWCRGRRIRRRTGTRPGGRWVWVWLREGGGRGCDKEQPKLNPPMAAQSPNKNREHFLAPAYIFNLISFTTLVKNMTWTMNLSSNSKIGTEERDTRILTLHQLSTQKCYYT